MSEIVKKVLDIISKLSQEDKAIIVKALTEEQVPSEGEKQPAAEETTEGDATMNPRNNPEVKDQNELMQRFLNHGMAR